MDIVYNPAWQVILCKRCQTCLGPSCAAIEQHLRRVPHELRGKALKACLAGTESLVLRSLEELKNGKPTCICLPIEHLKVWTGYKCLVCMQGNFLTIHLPQMQDYMATYSRKAKEYAKNLLWQECQF